MRKEMKDYWNRFKHLKSIEGMLLDENATTISISDRDEVISHLPAYENKCVLELAAGIGRFTGILAERAQKVIAVDFVQDFIDKNAFINKHRKNCEFVCADVLSYIYPESTDIVFSCWILMYLSDEEVLTLFNKVIKCLKPGGFFYFRESCYGNYHDMKNENRTIEAVNTLDFSNNPTHYRTPEDYETMIGTINDNGYTFSQEKKQISQVYKEKRHSSNQIFFLYKKE